MQVAKVDLRRIACDFLTSRIRMGEANSKPTDDRPWEVSNPTHNLFDSRLWCSYHRANGFRCTGSQAAKHCKQMEAECCYSNHMKPSVYIETTVLSYLTAWPSRNLVRAGQQQTTRDWWANRSAYELRVSSLVIAECGAGDSEAAAARLAVPDGVPILESSPEAEALAGI